MSNERIDVTHKILLFSKILYYSYFHTFTCQLKINRKYSILGIGTCLHVVTSFCLAFSLVSKFPIWTCNLSRFCFILRVACKHNIYIVNCRGGSLDKYKILKTIKHLCTVVTLHMRY